MSEADRIWRALMRMVQVDNQCSEITGLACREPLKCGCWLEAQSLVEDADTRREPPSRGGEGDHA